MPSAIGTRLPMKLTRKDRATLGRVLAAETTDFRALVELFGDKLRHALRGADLRGIDFGATDLSGIDLTLADVSGSDLSQVTGLDPAMKLVTDARTRLPRPLVPFIIHSDGPDLPEMVLIPPGSFAMGIPPEESKREGTGDDNARPVHPVTITRPFWLARYPLTRGEYAAFVADTGYDKDGGRWRNLRFPQDDRHPVVNVSHQDALAYLEWLNARTAGGYRLPSEAEWEYACRAGTTTARFWGDAWDGHEPYAWRGSGTARVDGRTANPFRLHDMLGNVREWCADPWHNNYRGAPGDGSVWETNGNDVRRVLRGGSWSYLPRYFRAGVRLVDDDGFRYSYAGFRPARTFLTS